MATSGCARPQAQMERAPLQEVEDPCMLVGLGHRHCAGPLVFGGGQSGAHLVLGPELLDAGSES